NWEMADGMVGTNLYTYTRASDSGDRVRIEVETETLAGPGEGMITRQLFIMGPEFDLARDFLNRMEFLQATVSQVGDGEPSLMQENVIEIMRQSAGDFTNSVTFKGQKEVQGFACDLYAYSFTLGGPHATVQEGEICLGETVPFGIVYQKGRVNGTDGAPVSSFEQKLLDSGAGKSGTEALLALTPETGSEPPEASPSLAFMDAYESGKIRLVVEVVEGTGGERLDLTAVNTTNDSIDLVVPGGPLAIPADSPLGVLNIVVRDGRAAGVNGRMPGRLNGMTMTGRYRQQGILPCNTPPARPLFCKSSRTFDGRCSPMIPRPCNGTSRRIISAATPAVDRTGARSTSSPTAPVAWPSTSSRSPVSKPGAGPIRSWSPAPH
ncbi:MAG: hypothetical protein P8127_08905, partial [Acidobacteriota bacterium]